MLEIKNTLHFYWLIKRWIGMLGRTGLSWLIFVVHDRSLWDEFECNRFLWDLENIYASSLKSWKIFGERFAKKIIYTYYIIDKITSYFSYVSRGLAHLLYI